jgi:hypothetical protein
MYSYITGDLITRPFPYAFKKNKLSLIGKRFGKNGASNFSKNWPTKFLSWEYAGQMII